MFRIEEVFSLNKGVLMREVFYGPPLSLEEDYINARRILDYLKKKIMVVLITPLMFFLKLCLFTVMIFLSVIR